jgi:hypothetical protein
MNILLFKQLDGFKKRASQINRSITASPEQLKPGSLVIGQKAI